MTNPTCPYCAGTFEKRDKRWVCKGCGLKVEGDVSAERVREVLRELR